MIKFTKKAGVAAAIAAVLGTSAHATVFNATASFRTIADVTITETTALSFGIGVKGKAATNCIVTATVVDTETAATTAFGASSTGCTTGSEAAGEYVIGGAASSVVTILMATATDTDYTFAPAGQFSDQEGTTDTITSYFSDSSINVTLDGTNDGLLAVGGELSILNDLTASTSYAVSYDISVIY